MPAPSFIRGSWTGLPRREESTPRKAIGTISSPSTIETRQLW
jgi:hypothetical protein